MIEQIEAELFHDFQTKGYSRPARMTCRKADGRTVEIFVKFSGGVREHYFGLCAELLCSLIAKQLGLLTPQPYIVNLSPAFLAGAPREAQDLIARSIGLNFGSQNAGDGFRVMPTEPRLSIAQRKVAAEIFAFDVMMQNFDRKWDNPNLLWDSDKILVIDHESAVHPILSQEEPSLAGLDLDKFYDHVFYSVLSQNDADYQQFASALGTLTPQVLDGFFEALPPVWRNQNALLKVRAHLYFIVTQCRAVCDLIRERIS